jgi:hypothetical protein
VSPNERSFTDPPGFRLRKQSFARLNRCRHFCRHQAICTGSRRSSHRWHGFDSERLIDRAPRSDDAALPGA